MHGVAIFTLFLAVQLPLPDLKPGPIVSIPTPPQQVLKWTPPSPPPKLSPDVISAITALFDDGLPDPRGCEYREIEIAETKTWKIKTHGWVLPTGKGEQLYAIGWNGVIYPVTYVGAPVDLEKDFTVMPIGQFRQNPDSDEVSLMVKFASPIKTAFLLRLGKTQLATNVWNAGYTSDAGKPHDPFADMSGLWLGRWFNQAMQAYLNGDYATAYSICQSLSSVMEKVKATALARGITNPWPDTYYGEHFWQLPTLEAESKRRAEEQPYTQVLESTETMSDSERIAGLIRDQEMVAVMQMMNPGSANVNDDPIVQALVKEGYPAVEPLLKCLVEDNRLTRSRYTEHMWYAGPVIPVYECAYNALFRILNVSFPVFEQEDKDYRNRKDPRNMTLDERKTLAAKIDAVWQKNKNTTPVADGYATLQDDNAGAQAWFRAIDNIVQPADGSYTMYRILIPPGTTYSVHVGAAPFAAFGDSLRGKTNPSVSELIIKRFNDVLTQPTSDADMFESAGKLILALADWDGKAHLDDLRDMTQAFAKRFPHEQAAFASSLQTETEIYQKRLELGDPKVLQEYADWLLKIDPKDWSPFRLGMIFQIMWHYPNDPIMQKTATALFTDPNSPWVPLTKVESAENLLDSPLIGMSAFRQEVLRGLGDTSLAGTVNLYDNGNASYVTTGRSQGQSMSSYKYDPLAPAPASGEPFRACAFRLCDLYAFKLGGLDGFPAAGLYWPPANRDTAITASKAFLQHYGDAFQGHPTDPYEDIAYATEPTRAHISFPKLDHPATPDDVEHGRAIFSLTGTVRQCTFLQFPVFVHRPSRKMDPYPASTSYPDGSSRNITEYVTEGQIWQAEEMEVNGQWERYYGFVGRYQLEKVPAGEIEFSGSFSGKLTKNLDTSLTGPPALKPGPGFVGGYGVTSRIPLGSPLPVTLAISNGTGLDQTVPNSAIPTANTARTLPDGISLSLSYSEKLAPVIHRWSDPAFDYGTFHEIPLNKDVIVANDKATAPILNPTQSLTVLKIDLRDFFDISHPGTYRVKALFHVPGESADHSNEITFSVADTGSR